MADTESNARAFDLGDVLSITTGRLVSPRLIDGVYDILNFMTQDSLFTHQLPRAADECRPWLLSMHPSLEAVSVEHLEPTEESVRAWLRIQKEQCGETLSVLPVPVAHTHRDPVDELVELVGPDRVIPVILDSDDPRGEQA